MISELSEKYVIKINIDNRWKTVVAKMDKNNKNGKKQWISERK